MIHGSWFRKFERPLIILAGASCLSLVLFGFDFSSFEGSLYDFRMRQGIQNPADQQIVLVALDRKTTDELNRFSPLSLDYHTEFLESLEEYKPKSVGYLVELNLVAQFNPELLTQPWANRFVQAAERIMRSGSPFLLGTHFDVTGEVLPPAAFATLPHSVSIIHRDGNVFSEDKVTRRAMLSLHNKTSFHLKLAQKMGLIKKGEAIRGSYDVEEVQGSFFFFRYHGNIAVNSKNSGAHNYTRYSFVDILKRKIPLTALKDKIVLVGTIGIDDARDFALTPYSKTSFTNPKLLVHANILDSIIHQDGITRVPSLVDALVTFLVITLVMAWTMTSTPLRAVFATLGLTLIFLAISHSLFQIYGIWLRESQPLVGIFAAYYLTVPYRLIREYKSRWNYQRRSELLTQVEQLKTNFISLVTHDLKTPVARIQGLAEVLLRKPNLNLTDNDRTRLKNIILSADELNHFISSILELSRIETDPVQLNFESKDVNVLIEKSVQEFSSQIKSKKIDLTCCLEPMFPIKLDTSLISKVLNNLIDNAIKYSPHGSRIVIESKEEDNFVVISIKDEGIGISLEEQQNLFTRFYRVKNDTTTSIPGTGLGLYLTKYFIEIHKGQVKIESKVGEGSTFQISLPISLESISSDSPSLTAPPLRSGQEYA